MADWLCGSNSLRFEEMHVDHQRFVFSLAVSQLPPTKGFNHGVPAQYQSAAFIVWTWPSTNDTLLRPLWRR
jgi:hypothetical protein